MIRVSVVGGSGYLGGELIRLLLGHPRLEITQVASRSQAGRPLDATNPNLRGFTDLRFVSPERLGPSDALICAAEDPQGPNLGALRRLAPVVVDCSPRLRLRDPDRYRHWYRGPAPRAETLGEAVYGLPELDRERLRQARLASGVGCSAAATILALLPVFRAGWELDHPTCIEARFGSSAAGARPRSSSHHPERARAVRCFAPNGHRHQAEVEQALGWTPEQLSYAGVAVEMVRGISVSARCFLRRPVTRRTVLEAFLACYRHEPFVRLVAPGTGLHRHPDPRWLSGTNLCDVGFALDGSGRRLTVLAALDNLGKGGAGNAIQVLNCMLGLEEGSGLAFMGLHPL
ncbi:MAG: N-acetyl-gamma-glutamyl-phosphate reductase [Candidatus Dormibacteria bacterium]